MLDRDGRQLAANKPVEAPPLTGASTGLRVEALNVGWKFRETTWSGPRAHRYRKAAQMYGGLYKLRGDGSEMQATNVTGTPSALQALLMQDMQYHDEHDPQHRQQNNV